MFIYKENSSNDEREVWVKFGELLIALDLLKEKQLEEALDYSPPDGKVMYIGEKLVELKFIDSETLQECLKMQKWFNDVLSNISHESGFVDVIKTVLSESFKCQVDIGSLRKVAFPNPLKDVVCIKFPISGKLNGKIYYISDRAFMQSLANTLMNSVGTSSDEFDESYVAVVSSVIISNSLNKLAQMGIFNSSDIPKILMEKEVSMDREIVIAEHKTISLIPLNNQYGRFAIGLDIQ